LSENRIAENIVICLDTSRSMFRTDFKPNRIYCCINALKILIRDRIQKDSKSLFAIVKFSDNAEKILDFTNNQDDLFKALDSITIEGKSNLGDGLGISIKILIGELRKVLGNIPRILVVSDGKNTQTAIDPLKMARLAQGLKIIIDSFRLGYSGDLNALKRVSELTNGKYYYSNNLESLHDSAQNLANSNIKQRGHKQESLIENPAYLRKIAANLLRVQDLKKSQELKMKQMRGEVDYKKCSICFQDNDPATKGSFYLTGRYCPNCQSPFHIHCLSAWANSQSEGCLKDSGTCRCPHCFYLLKIPSEVTQAEKLRTLSGSSSIKVEDAQKAEIVPTTLSNISDLGDNALYSSCPICNYIFEENQEVVQCGNCRAIYHIECFQNLEEKQCKSCGTKLHVY